jgi:protein-S-isoprenylcysteine O-methyltransferase Ste14
MAGVRSRALLTVLSSDTARRAITWSGGAVFAGSLAYCLYFYQVRLGTPQTAGEASAVMRAVAINIALFGLFALHHSLLARPAVKRRLTTIVAPTLERPLYVWTASLLLAITCWFWQQIPGTWYVVGGPARWMLFGVQLAGLVLTGLATARIDAHELIGARRLTSHVPRDPPARPARLSEPSPLQMGGPYGVVRHPIYLGWMMVVFGIPTMTFDRLLFAGLSTLYLFIAMPLEEQSLIETYGEPYRRYASEVRWRILPGIY